MAPPASLQANLQALRNEVERQVRHLRSEHHNFILSVWIHPASDYTPTSLADTFAKLTGAVNSFTWSRMEVYEAKYDEPDRSCGATCQCKAILHATEPLIKEATKDLNKDLDGFRLRDLTGKGGYYVLPTNSKLSDAAKGEIKNLCDKLEIIFQFNSKNMGNYMLNPVGDQKSVVGTLDARLNSALKCVLAEAINMKEDRKSDEFVYLLASEIKQVRDRYKAEWCAFHDSD